MIPPFPDASPSRFEPALRLAIEGRWSDSVRSVAESVTGREAAHGDEAAEALAEVSRLALEAGDPAAADEALVAALRIRPRQPDLLHQRATVRAGLGDRAEARTLLERALEAEPAHVAARLELSLLDAREGRLGEALASLRKLEHDLPEDHRDPIERGLRSLEHAEWEEAGRQLRDALDLGPEGVPHVVADVRRDLRDGRLDSAARRLEPLLERHPAHPDLHALCGEIEARRGALDDALASFGRALELRPDDQGIRLLFARALEGLGLRGQALEQVGFVLEREPGHADALGLEARWTSASRHSADREKSGSKPS